MAQAPEDPSNQQPGAAPEPMDVDNDQGNTNELEELKKQLAAKDAEIAALKADKDKANADNTTADGGDEDEVKAVPKMDVTLSIRGIPEYDSYPYAMPCEKFFYMASIKAPYFREDDRAPIDLVAVVDESGSMSGDRITLVRETIKFIIRNLESGDRFGIVGYSSGSREVLPLTTMDDAGRKKAEQLASGLRAQGGTALCQGLVHGVNMMRQRGTKNEIASVMILTDGQANQGPTSASEINASVRKGSVVSVQGGLGGYRNANVNPFVQNRVMQKPRQMGKRMKKRKQVPKLVQPPPQQMQQVQQVQQIQPVQGGPPGPVLQSTQQGPPAPPGPPSSAPMPPKPNDMIADDEEELKQPEGGADEGSEEIPCTINTFGFGAGHNENLLKALAENGRGMYAFIESTDQIADTFAECLGGLVSIVGQNLKVQVQALNNVEINRCLVSGYTVKEDVPKKKHTISVKDLQSEESRDFVFELKVPQIEAEKKEDPLVQLSVTYDNVVRGGTDTLTNICNITRIEGKQIGERNLELDLQYNRVLAADAMEEANKLASNGKLDDARKVLTTAQEHIKKSKTKQDEFCVGLVEDMQKNSKQYGESFCLPKQRSKNVGVQLCGAKDAKIDEFECVYIAEQI